MAIQFANTLTNWHNQLQRAHFYPGPCRSCAYSLLCNKREYVSKMVEGNIHYFHIYVPMQNWQRTANAERKIIMLAAIFCPHTVSIACIRHPVVYTSIYTFTLCCSGFPFSLSLFSGRHKEPYIHYNNTQSIWQ